MPQVTGRTTDPRTIAGVGTINTQKGLTAPAGSFYKGDVGRAISGTGIPAGATIASVASPTSAQLSVNATATGTVTVSVGVGNGRAGGFIGWSPENDTEDAAYDAHVAASSTTSDRITNPTTPRQQRNR